MNTGGSSYGNCHDSVRRRCRCGCHCDVCGRHFHPEKPAPNRPGQGGRPYLYRPARLEEDLSCASCEALLSEFGYNCRGGSRCLTKLARRLKQQEDFPHEIGLFLSYPPEDVKGFLEHRPCKCVGCWKVYENEEAAKKTFAKYKACTRVYCRQLASGIDIERLTVAG